jgi:hypothetical protein
VAVAHFGCGKPSLGGLTVVKTSSGQVASREAQKQRAAETSRRCKADKSLIQSKGGVRRNIGVYPGIYHCIKKLHKSWSESAQCFIHIRLQYTM